MSTTKVIKRTPDLGLTIRLQPLVVPSEPVVEEAVVPPTQGGCDVTGVTWSFVPKTYVDGEVEEDAYTWVELPNIDRDGDVNFFEWQGRALTVFFPELWQADYAPTWDPEHKTVVFGIPVGPDISGVVWEFAWENPPEQGEEAEQAGPLLRVTLPPVEGAFGYVNLLTATAKCGDAPVGVLRLMVLGTLPE